MEGRRRRDQAVHVPAVLGTAGGQRPGGAGAGSWPGAFRYENVKEAAPFRNDLRLLVRDSNLECEVQVQSLAPLTDQQVTAAWPAMAETVRALLPELRS